MECQSCVLFELRMFQRYSKGVWQRLQNIRVTSTWRRSTWLHKRSGSRITVILTIYCRSKLHEEVQFFKNHGCLLAKILKSRKSRGTVTWKVKSLEEYSELKSFTYTILTPLSVIASLTDALISVRSIDTCRVVQTWGWKTFVELWRERISCWFLHKNALLIILDCSKVHKKGLNGYALIFLSQRFPLTKLP